MDAYRTATRLFGFLADNVGHHAALPEPDLQLNGETIDRNQEGFGSPFFCLHRPTAWVELHREARPTLLTLLSNG